MIYNSVLVMNTINNLCVIFYVSSIVKLHNMIFIVKRLVKC